MIDVTWIGQAGLLLQYRGVHILVDPYLSYSVDKSNPMMVRRYPPDERFLDIAPDMIILTHSHLDHTDPDTLDRYLRNSNKKITVLASVAAWDKVRIYGSPHNYVRFTRGTEWTEFGLVFRAFFAEHSDIGAIGVIISDGEKNYCITGDTLYNREVIKDLSDVCPDYLFLPVNGVGNNMNMADATRFSKAVGARHVIPLHFGLYDDLTIDDFECREKLVLTPGERVTI